MASVKILTYSFFDRPTPEVAREMLGKWLCRRMSDGAILRMRISETEAYDGHEDKACHAHKGKTPRNEVMFGKAGFWYVYLCYGMHWMLNVVTGPIDFPAAVLVRGCVGIEGPGRLTKAFSISKDQDRMKAGESSGLWIEEDGFAVIDGEVSVGPRIGIGYAGDEWIKKPYRFVWKNALS